MAKVKIFKVGQWDKVQRIIHTENIINGFKAANELAMKNVASVGETMAVKFLRSQTLSWRPLAPGTLKRKLSKKPQGSRKILIDQSHYLNKITSWTDKGEGLIGVKKAAKSKDGKEELANIAAVLEFGSRARGIPARPLWHPVKNHLVTFIKAKKPFIDALRNKFGR